MITGTVGGADILGVDIKGVGPVALARLQQSLTQAALVVGERMAATLPDRLKDKVKIQVDTGPDEIHVGIWVAGREAHDFLAGADRIIDVAAYVRAESMVFGRPVHSIDEQVRAYSRRFHQAAWDGLDGFEETNVSVFENAVTQTADQLDVNL